MKPFDGGGSDMKQNENILRYESPKASVVKFSCNDIMVASGEKNSFIFYGDWDFFEGDEIL